MNKKKTILSIVLAILCVVGAFSAIYFPNSQINDVISETQNIILQEIVVSDEVQKNVNETIEATNKDEDISTTEVIESSIEEEQEVFDEGALETDAVVEQENISYNGDNSGKGLSLLGAYQGLTYYSQADSRWANVMYSSVGNTSQTMKSSACGPTSAAMVVSSSKGAILPTTMAQLFVDNGYRTASNGTAWSAYSFVADYFDFEEYHTTSNFDTAMNYLSQKNSDGSSKYYIIASCGSGLFTTGGHYICLMSLDNSTITVYDPYVYSTKFSTASRKSARVVLDGNTAYVSESSFKTYANYKYFWIFSNDEGEGNPNTTSSTKTTSTTANTSYTRYVNVKSNSNLYVRKKASKSSTIVDKLTRGTKVTVYETSGKWSRIGTNKWVYTDYLSKTKPTTIKNTVGQIKILKSRTTLYSKSSLTGTKYTYLANTKVKIIKNISSTVDYVYVIATKRYAYIKNNVYK